nr:retrovirus-related Pol polyprotein from transposon TNT 1-94 [Tanacetum cinerariifolium]
MRMEQDLTHTNYALWEVIVNGDAPAVITSVSGGAVPPKTTGEKIARRNELKAKSTLLFGILDEHLLKFHGIKDAKTLWEAIKTRFGGNKESKKIQKTILKQQYENFVASRSEGLDKTYDRFQKLISQLEIHGELISQEDANIKLLRSAPPAWNTHTLIMRNKSDLDTLSMDDLYNNLKVCEVDFKGQSSSSLNSQNVAFVSSDNTSITNEAVTTVHDVSTASSQGQTFASTYVDDVMFSFFANKSNSGCTYHEGEEIYKENMKESEFQWERNLETPANALVVTDGMGYDWSYQAKEGPTYFALMTFSSSCSYSSDTKLDDSIFKSTISETITSMNETKLSTSKTSKKSLEKPKTVRPMALITEDWESDSDDDSVITNSRKVQVNAAKQSSPRVAASTSTARYVNTAAKRPTVNVLNMVDLETNKNVIDHISKDSGSYMLLSPSLLIIKRLMKDMLHLRSPKGGKISGKGLVGFSFWPLRMRLVESLNHLSQNRVLVTKPHNKTPYELLIGRTPNLDFMKPFGCPVTILNTLNHLGKFERKVDEGFLVGYSVNSKAFRVFNSRTKRVEENLHIEFLENKPNITGRGIEINANAGKAIPEKASDHEYILLLFRPSITQSLKDKDAGEVPEKGDDGVSKESGIDNQEKTDSSTQDISTAEPSINTASTNINTSSLNINTVGSNDPKADTNNLELSTAVSPVPTTRMHKDHPKEQIIGDLNLATQTRRMLNFSEENVMARLVAQGHTQEEGIDYDEVFSPVARIEAIRIFLAYASFMRIILYQMDVKSSFLYGIIKKKVYGCQPPGFEDLHFPNKVYKVEKALYGLHQAPKAWYKTLSTYLLENGFRRGTIDKTLFIKKDRDDILLVQVYVDDIIFGSTKKSLCNEFKQIMHKRFQMSSIRELTFFLRLQVKQKDDGIFISQDKYVADIIKKFDFTTVKTTSTPMELNKTLIKDAEAEDVDVNLYRSMIRSLMYLTASRPDIMFAVCTCARFQVTPKTSHLHAVKRIFRYLKGQPKLGLWYPRDSPFNLEAFSNSDYARASLDTKSTTGGCKFLGKRLISWQCKKQTVVANSTTEAEYVAAASCCGHVLWIQNQMLDYGLNLMNTKIYIDNEREDDKVVRAATTAASLKAEQESEINTSGNGEDTMEHQDELTNFVPPTPHDLPLLGGHTPGSDEGRPNINELMNLCTQLSNRVLALKQFKTAQGLVIKRLQKKVKRLEKKQRARTLRMKLFKIGTSKKKTLDKENVSKQGRDENNRTKELNLSDKGSRETQVFDYTTVAEKDVNAAEPVSTAGDAVNAASVIPNVSATGPSTSDVGPSTSTTEDIFKDEMTTMADTLMAIRSTRPRTTLVVIHDVEEEPKRATPPPTVQSQDKEQEAKDAALIAQIEDVQARIDANALLAKRLQQEEREKFTIDEQARMLVDLITEIKRFFAAQKAKQIRNKPPTKAQLRNKMQAESSKKRSRADHDKESVKKQKLEEDDAEKEELAWI